MDCKYCSEKHKETKHKLKCKRNYERRLKGEVEKPPKIPKQKVAKVIVPIPEEQHILTLRGRQIEKRRFSQFRMEIEDQNEQKPQALDVTSLLHEYRGLYQSLDVERRMPKKQPAKIRKLIKIIENFPKRRQFMARRRAILKGEIIPEVGEVWQQLPKELMENHNQLFSEEERRSQLQRAYKDEEARLLWNTKKKMKRLGRIGEELKEIMSKTPQLFKQWKLQSKVAWSNQASRSFETIKQICRVSKNQYKFSLKQLYDNFDKWASYRENIIFLQSDLTLFYERKYRSMMAHRQKIINLLNFGPSSFEKFYTHLNKFIQLSPLKSYANLLKGYQLFINQPPLEGQIIPQRIQGFIIRVMETLIANFVVHPRDKILPPPTDALGFESPIFYEAYLRIYYYLLARLPVRPALEMARPRQWCINRDGQQYRTPYASQEMLFSDIQELIMLLGGLYVQTTGNKQADLSSTNVVNNLFPLDKPVIIYQASAFHISHNSRYYYLGFSTSDFETDTFQLRACLLDVEGNFIDFKAGKMYYLLPLGQK